MTPESGRTGSRRAPAVRLLAVLTALLLAAFTTPFVGAATASTSPPQTWTVLVGSQSLDGAISGSRFLPGDITIDAGDTVTWAANSLEPHTVTFLPGDATLNPSRTFNPATDAFPAGGHAYDGMSYYNSGLLSTVPQGGDLGPFPSFIPHFAAYSLTFPSSGTFVYYCLIHGVMMMGTVHVNPAGTAYPMSQAQIDMAAAAQARAIVTDGNVLRARMQAQATMDRVIMGADDGLAMVMRFLHPVIVVKAGTTVTFDNTQSMGAPHTVTIGAEPSLATLETYVPTGTYDGTGNYSTFVPPGLAARITFTTPGTYNYKCALHDYMGMTGQVIVIP